MIEINIPGRDTIIIENIVFDYNGTIAVDGIIPEYLKDKFIQLSKLANLYVVTADTYGTAIKECEKFGLNVKTFPKGEACLKKHDVVEELNPEKTACLGNGFNDQDMLMVAKLSIGVLSEEGIYAWLFDKCDVIVKSIEDALDLFLKPNRIVALLRK